MIRFVAALVLFQTTPQRLTIPLRVLQISPDAKVSIVGSTLNRRVWGSVIVGPREKLDKELEKLLHDGKAKSIDSHSAQVYATEPMLWSVNKNGDSLEVRATLMKAGPPADLSVAWRFTGGPSVTSTDLTLGATEEALVTAYLQNGRKLMLVVRVDAG